MDAFRHQRQTRRLAAGRRMERIGIRNAFFAKGLPHPFPGRDQRDGFPIDNQFVLLIERDDDSFIENESPE